MLTNAFIGKSAKPTDADLSAALGPAKAIWDQLLSDLALEQGVNVHEWTSHNVKWGWSLRVLREKRTIVWLSPVRGGFNVGFILGDKALQATRQVRLPQRVVQVLEAAPKYPEGTGVRLVVKSARHLPTLKKLAAIKVAN